MRTSILWILFGAISAAVVGFVVVHKKPHLFEKWGQLPTSTITLLPIFSALSMAQKKYGCEGVQMGTVNEKQKTFVAAHWVHKNDIDLLQAGEICSTASYNVVEVNEFLRAHNFQIQLRDGGPESLYVASILKIALAWHDKGEKTTLAVNNKKYPAVRFERRGKQPFKVYDAPAGKNGNPILELAAKNGDMVYMMVAPANQEPLREFDLLDSIAMWQQNKIESAVPYSAVIFPMVSLDQEVDIRWLLGMNFPTSKGPAQIAQALQQTKFRMNEEGAMVQSAVAIEVQIGIACPNFNPPPVFCIDDSFYIWIMRPGMKTPIFAAYVDKSDAWQEPESLEK